jgi:small subunit ribosomal protein S19
MAERVAFRGMTPSEVVKITDEQYLKLINSRQRRTIKRNSLDYRDLISKVDDAIKNPPGKPIRTHVREAVILKRWIGLKFEVHNGKEWKLLTITANMLNHRLGEFAFTTKRVIHSDPGIRATRGSKFLAMK